VSGAGGLSHRLCTHPGLAYLLHLPLLGHRRGLHPGRLHPSIRRSLLWALLWQPGLGLLGWLPALHRHLAELSGLALLLLLWGLRRLLARLGLGLSLGLALLWL
jgi:hypothetical protein